MDATGNITAKICEVLVPWLPWQRRHFEFFQSSKAATHIFVFFNFLVFWPFPWKRQPFLKNQPLKAQLHMAYDIPTRFHKV